MTTHNIGLSADSKTVYVTIDPEALPGAATNVLADIEHDASGANEDDLVDPAHGENHALYHDVREALYHEDILDMQSISIVKHGAIWGATALIISPVTNLDVSNGDTATLVINYDYPDKANAVATNSHFTYVSSDPTKATVNAAGLVTAVAAGTSTITVTQANSGLSAQIVITVVA